MTRSVADNSLRGLPEDFGHFRVYTHNGAVRTQEDQQIAYGR